jgi:phosphoribosylanthranilate isomerase
MPSCILRNCFLIDFHDVVEFLSWRTGRIGGTGKTADIGIIKAAKITKPFLAAGGIGRDNAAGIIRALSPFGVDISSSAETDGIKDENKIRDIIRTVREVV